MGYLLIACLLAYVIGTGFIFWYVWHAMRDVLNHGDKRI